MANCTPATVAGTARACGGGTLGSRSTSHARVYGGPVFGALPGDWAPLVARRLSVWHGLRVVRLMRRCQGRRRLATAQSTLYAYTEDVSHIIICTTGVCGRAGCLGADYQVPATRRCPARDHTRPRTLQSWLVWLPSSILAPNIATWPHSHHTAAVQFRVDRSRVWLDARVAVAGARRRGFR